jgi:hypothetical protein
MEKKKYKTPRIEIIFLDNEISLELESTPPEGPNEVFLGIEHRFKNNPFNDNLS